ncbi:MAG: hypothetical protein ACI9YH_004589 [Colwellia sp.]|jgi:hypothetical protein
MKLTHLAFLSITLIFSQKLSAADNKDADRWFEMEVILFSQLGDKTKLKEQFPENTTLPKYKEVIDFLGPYLNPDITSLKQLLPSCDDPIYPDSLLNQSITLIKEQPYYVEKSLIELEKSIVNIDSKPLINSSPTSFSDGTNTQSNSVIANNTEEYIEQNNTLNLAAETDDIDSLALSQQSLALSAEQLEQQKLLLKEAEAEFSLIQFSYTDETASFTQLICTISIEEFKELNQSLKNSTYENYTSFNIDRVPSTINNSEDIFSDDDYLLSEESLQLKDIVKQLTRSQNFRPLLHLGWRQKTKTKELAVPIKIFAGENFGYQYEQELHKFQQQLAAAKDQEDILHNALYNDKTDVEELSEEALKQKALTERLQELIVKLPNLPTDAISLLSEVNKDITHTNAMLNPTNMLPAPIKPPQNWTLDGFLKIEVDFYLHITADFNVMNMSLAQLATQQLLPENNERKSTKLETINFKQDRRVRSKEIHYFDHPYVGMIIRILPYEKPIEEVEESASLN